MNTFSNEFHRIYPKHVPVILKSKSTNIQMIKSRYIVPNDLSFTSFINIIRQSKHIIIKPDQAIVGLIDQEIMPMGNDIMGDLFHKYKHENGLLYIDIDIESVFG